MTIVGIEKKKELGVNFWGKTEKDINWFESFFISNHSIHHTKSWKNHRFRVQVVAVRIQRHCVGCRRRGWIIRYLIIIVDLLQ